MKYNMSVDTKNILQVSGAIDLDNVVSACSCGKELIDTLAVVRIDLMNLEQSDSSCLAMFIDWIRSARAQHKDIMFTNMPQSMLDLARVCGLDIILPVDKFIKFQN